MAGALSQVTDARRRGTYEGKPVWRAYWRRDATDRWRAVRNSDDRPIAYASRETALRAADFVREMETSETALRAISEFSVHKSEPQS